MPDLPSSAPPHRAWRRWIPSPGTAALLAVLTVLVWMLRSALVTSKALVKAKERWAAAREGTSGAPFKWEDAAVLGTHWSTLAALVGLIAALLTLRWWHPPASPATLPATPAPRASRWFLPALVGIVLLGGALRVPLATGSLWWDELWNVKYATVGEWRQEAGNPDEVRFLPTSWTRAAWYYNKPTNHPVFTLPSKAAHEVWRTLTRPENPGAFNELVLRLPVLLGGLSAMVLTALLARRLAGERAGIITALLMALHPWLIRYGVDARSYGLAVAFMAAALFSLERATSEDVRHPGAWWWAFGACQFLLMWSHVLAHLAVCAGLFGAAAWLILRRGGEGKARQLARLVIINAVAAALLLVAFLPNLLQAATWGERNDDGNLLTAGYLLRTLTQAAAGMEPPPASGGISPEWAGMLFCIMAGAAMAVIGGMVLLKQRSGAAVILLATLGATLLFLVVVHLSGFYFYHRFIITVIIPLVVLVATGLSRLPGPVLPAAALLGFASLTFPQTRLLLTRSYAPFRETAADLRAEAAHHPGKVIPVGYGLGSHVMQCYYPELRDIRGNAAPALQKLIDQARLENRPLLVALGYEGINRLNLPDGFKLLDDPALFEKISTRHGLEPEFTFNLLRLKSAVP